MHSGSLSVWMKSPLDFVGWPHLLTFELNVASLRGWSLWCSWSSVHLACSPRFSVLWGTWLQLWDLLRLLLLASGSWESMWTSQDSKDSVLFRGRGQKCLSNCSEIILPFSLIGISTSVVGKPGGTFVPVKIVAWREREGGKGKKKGQRKGRDHFTFHLFVCLTL